LPAPLDYLPAEPQILLLPKGIAGWTLGFV
jgi:hypothetical protein